MESSSIPTESKAVVRKKRRKSGGRPPKITAEIIERIAERVAHGVPKKYACALDDVPVSVSGLDCALARSTVFTRVWDRKIASIIEPAMDSIRGRDAKTLPVGTCWWLERCHGFSTSKQAAVSLTINNTVVGIQQDVMNRAQVLLKNSYAPKEKAPASLPGPFLLKNGED